MPTRKMRNNPADIIDFLSRTRRDFPTEPPPAPGVVPVAKKEKKPSRYAYDFQYETPIKMAANPQKYVRSNPGGFLRALDRDQPRHDRRVRALNNPDDYAHQTKFLSPELPFATMTGKTAGALKIYLIEAPDWFGDYGTYAKAIVVASSPSHARSIHPSGDDDAWSWATSWPSMEDVKVTFVGDALPGAKPSVLVAHQHAG